MSTENYENYPKDAAVKYQKYCKQFPISEKSIFAISSIGFVDAAECNPYYLAKNAIQRNDFTVYISSNNIEYDKNLFVKDSKIVWVNPNNSLYLTALATAKYIITNGKMPAYFCKRKGQILLTTWQGTPLKKLDKNLNKYSQATFLQSDYILCSNEHTRAILQETCFLDKLYTGKWLVTGYPKNSILAAMPPKKYVGKRTYAYMPTWREDSTRILQIEKYFDRLDSYLSSDVTIYVKFHNLSKKIMKSYKHIQPFPPNVEQYQFLTTVDCLITDYSSVIFDFANTGKEIILFAFDENSYLQAPGLNIPLDKLPFTKYNILDDLIKHIKTGKPFVPGQYYIRFLDEFCKFDTPTAADQVNAFLLDSKPIENSYIIDETANASVVRNAYFMPQIESNRQLEELKAKIPQTEPAVFVFSANFTKYTQQMLNELDKINKDNETNLSAIIVNTNVAEKFKLTLNNKYGIFQKTAQQVCLREKERIFQQLTIGKYTNFSTEPLFTAMEKMLN
ncbi:MAG: CDP-glycerol glycerophosphotransferase family protein [Firmicutes bacterium]|nr:CDP-glycerol glycerophosphotransferase family protein [Bacillota bacterium]